MSARVARQIFLRSMAPTRAISDGTARVADLMEDVYYPRGTVIYRRGEAPIDIYFVVTGTVHLIGDEHEPPWVMDSRSLIGIMDANLERPRARSAIAHTDVHLLRFNADDYLEMMEDNFEQQRAVVANTTSGLRGLIADLAPSGGFPEPSPEAMNSGTPLRPLNPIERLLALRSVAAFSSASVQTLASLMKNAEDLPVPEGDLALRPGGGKNGALLIVARGVVELERDIPPLSARFGPRTIAGGLASFQDEMSGARFRALTPGLLVRVRNEDLIDVMEDHFDLTRSLLRHSSLERERLMTLKLRLRPQ